jgi:NAD(P)H-dependent flavin oxidoreductase YrpB (nitropropane dioxygenase family)
MRSRAACRSWAPEVSPTGGERCCVDAEGAWIGTAFLATEEAGIHPFQKEALVESGDTDTVVSKSVTGKPARLVRNKWAQAWADAGKEPLPMPHQIHDLRAGSCGRDPGAT